MTQMTVVEWPTAQSLSEKRPVPPTSCLAKVRMQARRSCRPRRVDRTARRRLGRPPSTATTSPAELG
eukprot:6174558-Pleurochrysis_carterae.AAC.2